MLSSHTGRRDAQEEASEVEIIGGAGKQWGVGGWGGGGLDGGSSN